MNDKVELPFNIMCYGINIKTTLCTNNDDIFIIDYTNTNVVITANDKQRELQKNKVENTVPNKRTNTNNADNKATMIAAIVTFINLQNDKRKLYIVLQTPMTSITSTVITIICNGLSANMILISLI